MPSFYVSRQLPLTPPEYSTGYQSSGCAGMHYQQHSYAAPQNMGRQEEAGYDLQYNGRHGQPQASAQIQSSMVHLQQSYQHATVSIPPVNPYADHVVGLPLPPVRSFDQSHFSGLDPPAYQRHQEYRPHFESQPPPQQQPPKAKEEKAVGGVSAKLDYDMDWMTDFVSDMALKIVQPGKPSHDGFRNWVHSVLIATRLPSATIVLSLHYLSLRMTMLQNTRQGAPYQEQIYRLLTVSLILGSKFLDDNTFINRSWADVSLIEVQILNKMELEWLMAIDFKLHRPIEEEKGFQTWLAHWKEWEAQSLARGARSLKLSPLDTNVQHHQGAAHKSFTPQSTQSAFPPPSAQDYSARPQQHQPRQYHTPSYATYDPWLIPRSATIDTSPASAPHTGPTTPEYYGGPGTWAPLEKNSWPRVENGTYSYSGQTYGFAPLSQPRALSRAQPLQSAPAYTPFTPQYQHHNVWNHPMHCTCGNCARQHMPYFMASGFGQVAAA